MARILSILVLLAGLYVGSYLSLRHCAMAESYGASVCFCDRSGKVVYAFAALNPANATEEYRSWWHRMNELGALSGGKTEKIWGRDWVVHHQGPGWQSVYFPLMMLETRNDYLAQPPN